MYSLVVPVYKNADSIDQLLHAIEVLNKKLDYQLEATFVVDGSPDNSFNLLTQKLPNQIFQSQLILLSKNFGSYAAIRAGLAYANGQYFAVMAADLQEPPELILDFFAALKNDEADVTFGIRRSRKDPLRQKFFSNLYWYFYRKFIQHDMPIGGVDIFGCNLAFRNELLSLNESNSSLIGLSYWLGFRRKLISYDRLERISGKSSWSLKKKIKYAMDSAFAFTDLPITFLYYIGIIGVLISFLAGCIVLFAKINGNIDVPGYAATIITITFFGALNAMGLGVIGSYVWRTFENTKLRPQNIVMIQKAFNVKGQI